MEEPKDLDAMTVAYLAAEGMTQTAIGLTLGLSQSAVSRLMGIGYDENIYLERRPPYRLKAEKIGDQAMEAILRRASRKLLAKYLDDLAKKNGHMRGPAVRVLPSTPEGTGGSESRARRFMEFARQAVPYVVSLLNREPVRTCGVTWGYMLHDLCVALRQLNRPTPWKREAVQITPLSGDPLQDRKNGSPALTSSNIAADLGRIVNGDQYRAAWLGLVPAFIPEEFNIRQKDVIDRMVHMVPEYEEIFGRKGDPDSGAAGRLDMLLTSVGTAENPLGFGNGRLLGSLGPKLETLKEQIAGDVGGVLLPLHPDEPSPLLRVIEHRWQGLRRRHIELCVERASREDPVAGRPGSVVLSLGADRAVAIKAAVAGGLVSHLIIDSALEHALEAMLIPPPLRPA